MGRYIVTVVGEKMRYVFNHADKNYVGLREMTEALEGAFINRASASGGAAFVTGDLHSSNDAPSVEYDENTETSTFRVYDRLACEIKEISFIIKNTQPDIVTPRLVTINGSNEYIDFVLHEDRNMIGVRDFAKLTGLEGYLQWYDKDGDQFVELRNEDPYDGCGGLKEFADATVAKHGGAIPSESAFDFYQTIFDTGYLRPKKNRYSGYVFTFTDAAQWLMQTGGRVNFVLQVRDTNDAADQVETAIAGQWNIMLRFLQAYDALSRCGYGNAVMRPRFYVGTPEEDVSVGKYGADGVISIFKGILQKLRDFGYSEPALPRIVKGIYFGSESAKSQFNLEIVRNYIDSFGGELIWIPYFMNENERDAILALSGYFDKIILQPSTFYYGANAYKNVGGAPSGEGCGDDFSIGKKWNAIFDLIKLNPIKFGVELEYDMGLVTGRSDPEPSMAPVEKKRAFVEYINRLFGAESASYGRFPIGIYSGGPNEQGYNNAELNSNIHNNDNHIPTVKTFDTGSKYCDLYKGNLVYKIGEVIFNNMNAEGKRTALSNIINEIL